MATILKRGQYQYQATIRRKNHPSQSKIFVTKRDAAALARGIESEMDLGRYVPTKEADNTHTA